jgi:Josephin
VRSKLLCALLWLDIARYRWEQKSERFPARFPARPNAFEGAQVKLGCVFCLWCEYSVLQVAVADFEGRSERLEVCPLSVARWHSTSITKNRYVAVAFLSLNCTVCVLFCGGVACLSGTQYLNRMQQAALCGVHCLNTLLQGPYFSEWDLSAIAQKLDELERKLMGQRGFDTPDFVKFAAEGSGNVARDGMFSIQVCEHSFFMYGMCPQRISASTLGIC